MKKKLFAVLMFAVFASLAFAQYDSPPSYEKMSNQSPLRHEGGWMDFVTYFSVNFVAPIQWQNIKYWDREINARTASFGVGIDLTTFLTRHTGLHISADIYFPQTMEYGAVGSSHTESTDLQDWWDSDWGLSVFVGPSFALLRTPRILFALAPGIHYYMLFAEKGRQSVFQYAIGAGANAELMVNVTRSVFLRAAVDVTYDFWGSEEEYFDGFSTDYSDIGYALNVTPQVGIGVKI